MLKNITRNKEDHEHIAQLEGQIQQIEKRLDQLAGIDKKLDKLLQLLEEDPKNKTTLLVNTVAEEVGQRLTEAIKDAETIQDIKSHTKFVAAEVEGLKQKLTDNLAGKGANCMRCGGSNFVGGTLWYDNGGRIPVGILGTNVEAVANVCRQCGLIRLQADSLAS